MFAIYKITIIDDSYIGHTKNFNKRTKDHQYRKNDDKYKHIPLYKKMNECDDFKIELLEMIDCDKETIFIKEQEYISLHNPTLNTNRACGQDIELVKYKNKIRMRNLSPEKKAEIAKKQQEKTKLTDWKNELRIECDCGGKYQSRHKFQHCRTKKHILFLNLNISD
tara:strand:+ start:197 stop:694 length:498 start_codon:yes stop_codon:yes gene_type:complete